MKFYTQINLICNHAMFSNFFSEFVLKIYISWFWCHNLFIKFLFRSSLNQLSSHFLSRWFWKKYSLLWMNTTSEIICCRLTQQIFIALTELNFTYAAYTLLLNSKNICGSVWTLLHRCSRYIALNSEVFSKHYL